MKKKFNFRERRDFEDNRKKMDKYRVRQNETKNYANSQEFREHDFGQTEPNRTEESSISIYGTWCAHHKTLCIWLEYAVTVVDATVQQ